MPSCMGNRRPSGRTFQRRDGFAFVQNKILNADFKNPSACSFKALKNPERKLHEHASLMLHSMSALHGFMIQLF